MTLLPLGYPVHTRYRREFLVNSVIARIPHTDARLRALQRIGRLQFEEPASTFVARSVRFQGPDTVRIGARSVVNFGAHIDGRGGVEIGRDTALTPYVTVVTALHHPDDEMATIYQPVRIGDHVLVNARATILPGVEVGDGALVAAGSVVVKDVEPWTIVAGNPAKPLRARARQNYRLGHWRPDWQ